LIRELAKLAETKFNRRQSSFINIEKKFIPKDFVLLSNGDFIHASFLNTSQHCKPCIRNLPITYHLAIRVVFAKMYMSLLICGKRIFLGELIIRHAHPALNSRNRISNKVRKEKTPSDTGETE